MPKARKAKNWSDMVEHTLRLRSCKISVSCFLVLRVTAVKTLKLRYFLFKRCGVYLISGLLGAAFISKIKIKENEILSQFKTIRYFLNHAVSRATTPRLDLVTRFRSACSGGKTFSIFCLIFIRWSQLFSLYCSWRRFYQNSETTVQWEHQRSTTAFKIMVEEESLHGLFLTGVVVVRSCQGQFLMR